MLAHVFQVAARLKISLAVHNDCPLSPCPKAKITWEQQSDLQ